MNETNPTIHGRTLDYPVEKFPTWTRRTLFTDYGVERARAFTFEFYPITEHRSLFSFLSIPRETQFNRHYSYLWTNEAESVSIVESGRGELWIGHDHKKYTLTPGVAFYLPRTPEVRATAYLSNISKRGEPLRITSLQLPSDEQSDKANPAVIVDPSTLDWKIFEYETLGREVLAAPNKRMGLLQLAFPMEKIPLHTHPYSDRFIRTISGHGFVYIDPYKYEMGEDDAFIAFPRNVVHTNGPKPREKFVIWSFHFPWIDPEIDEENIAGSEAYAKYLQAPPKPLWKTKAELLSALERKIL